MKLKIFLSILFFVIILGVLGYLKAIPGIEEVSDNYPLIEVTPDFFDFFEIEYGSIVEHTFKIKNIGNKDLEINKIATSCACTSAEIEKEIIMPNEEINLKVTYNTGLMSGPHGKGDQERIIYIRSNDPINPQIEATIHAYVK